MHVPHLSVGTLLLAAAALHAPAHAYQVKEWYDVAFQMGSAGLGYGVYGGPWQPPIAKPGQKSDYQIITPGTATWPFAPGRYIGGDGIAFESTVQGPAVFYPNIEQPFQAHAWAVASNRTGQLVAHAHGAQFEQIRTMPLPMGITGPQFDGLWAGATSSAQTINHWEIQLDRSAASQLTTQPLTFGLTLDVNTHYALKPDNAADTLRPDTLGSSTLEVSLTFRRLALGIVSGTPEMPDGGPLEITTHHTYLFDSDNQGRQTLRIEQSISELMHFWVDIGSGSGLALDGSTGLRARSCLDIRPLTYWDNLCTIQVTADIRLATLSGMNIAEADVSATWDVTQNGGTAGIRQMSDLQMTTPGFAPSNSSGYNQMFIRGVGNAIVIEEAAEVDGERGLVLPEPQRLGCRFGPLRLDDFFVDA